MRILLFLFAILFQNVLFAQDNKRVVVKAGQRIMQVLTSSDVYYFPNFVRGKLFYKDGTKSVGDLNYSSLLDEMLFLNGTTDTLAVADENTIDHIAFKKDTFYYDHGFLRHVLGNKIAKLGIRNVWSVGEDRKVGAFGITSSTSDILVVTDFFGMGWNHNLTVNQEVVLRKIIQYCFADNKNRFLIANKKNLFQLFPAEKQRLASYLKENKVDFGKEDDLKKIIELLGKS